MNLIKTAAMVAHEVNKAYCESLGDWSQLHWDDAPLWQRQSARAGAAVAVSSSSVGPGDSHAGWLTMKQNDGWVYGPVKDPEKKEHPCMVPFDELPPEQKAKDFLFLGTVRAVADAWRDMGLFSCMTDLDQTIERQSSAIKELTKRVDRLMENR